MLVNKNYIKGYVAIALIFMASITNAESNHGIKELNHRLSSDVSYRDSGRDLSIAGSINIPMKSYFGASVVGSANRFYGESNYIDSNQFLLNMSLLAKNHNLGSVSVNYGYGYQEFDSFASDRYYHSIGVSGKYFYKDVNLGISRTVFEQDFGSSNHLAVGSITYFLTNNLSFNVSALRMDSKSEQYSITFKPEFLIESLSTGLSYSDYEESETVSLSISYYFNTSASLKDLARKY